MMGSFARAAALTCVFGGLACASPADPETDTDASMGTDGEGAGGSTTGPPANGASTTGEGGSGGADEQGSSSTSASPGETDDGAVDLGCDTVVFEQAGEVKLITHEDSQWLVSPLPAGASFRCLRLAFDLQTVDSQQEILDMYPGCPIFLGIAAVDGQGPEGKPMASMLFKPWRVGCTPGPDRVELDTFADALVEQGPWPLGGLYHVRIEVDLDTETSSVMLSQDGVQVGPTLAVGLAGITLETARDPRVGFGMAQPAGDAYFPDYGATYSNVRITAEVVP